MNKLKRLISELEDECLYALKAVSAYKRVGDKERVGLYRGSYMANEFCIRKLTLLLKELEKK